MITCINAIFKHIGEINTIRLLKTLGYKKGPRILLEKYKCE